ncbi:hypothetical protein Pelo_9327 [Pelomyxa schiedti]|nr:hypothetical protein Pelo_9327 [Pelomyxa schiedti]
MAAEGAKSVGKYVVVVGDDDDPTIPPGEDSDGGYGTDDDDDYDDGVAEEEEDDDERAVARKVDRLLEDVESMPDPEIASDAARSLGSVCG